MIFENTYFLWVKLSIGSDDYVNVDIFAYFKIIETKKRRNIIGATAVIYTFMNLCLKRFVSSIYLYKHTYSVVAQAVQYKNHGALHKNRKICLYNCLLAT